MHSPSRRAFLRGRRPATTSWEQFCQRLQAFSSGKLVTFDVPDGLGLARLTVEQAGEVPRILSLCNEFGVVLSLDGVTMPARDTEHPTLRLRPSKSLAQFDQLDDHSGLWFVQPGCTLRELAEAGMSAFSTLPGSTTVAAWLADRTLVDYLPGQTALSGVEHLQLLLPDGEALTLGPFGHDNARPLESQRARQLVSSLFRLTSDATARSWLEHEFWPLRYRLDALMPVQNASVNLAHLVLGHGGDLGWVQWVVLNPDKLDANQGITSRYSADLIDFEPWVDSVNELDRNIKALFDPQSVLSVYGQDI